MIFLKLIIFALCLQFSWAKFDYYGPYSNEATLEFRSKVLYYDDFISLTQARRSEDVKELINFQINHLMGHFQSNSFLESFGNPGILGMDRKFVIEKVYDTEDGSVIEYSFKGNTNFHSQTFRSRSVRSIPIRLPLNPYDIYHLSYSSSKNKNFCTDTTYNGEEDFYYFWDPEQKNCPLTGNKKDVLHFNGSLKKINNTIKTYPEYQHLYNNNPLKISILFGYISKVGTNVNKKDEGYINFQDTKNFIEKQGFKIKTSNHNGINFLYVYQKSVRTQLGSQINIEIDLSLSDSNFVSSHTFFSKQFTKAALNSHIIAYDGHSELGANLEPSNILGNKRLPSFYQLMFFNGCNTYTYFNDNYFKLKSGGSKNLDIITSGLATYASHGGKNMTTFLAPFIKGEIVSYQNLLQKLENSNSDIGQWLFGVNGDHDNKFTP